jgi:hypothetical protein
MSDKFRHVSSPMDTQRRAAAFVASCDFGEHFSPAECVCLVRCLLLVAAPGLGIRFADGGTDDAA